MSIVANASWWAAVQKGETEITFPFPIPNANININFFRKGFWKNRMDC